MFLILLTSGLFLGWSLGANDAANVFGTAVGSKMLKFKTAAIICGIFVILGAVIGGGGTSESVNELGSISTLEGSFLVALAAAITVFGMSKINLPVSTSQAIIGAIIGWLFFAELPFNIKQLTPFVSAWVFSPIIAGVSSVLMYLAVKWLINKRGTHLLRIDLYIRLAFIAVCVLGAYNLGANNIANVMGVFVMANPFTDFSLMGVTLISGEKVLFFTGGLAIAVGIYTYSHKVVKTVGKNIFRLSPVTGLAVVLSNVLVLFLFSSTALKEFLTILHLPPLPLVPISSSQAIVGAIIGIGILKGARSIRYRVLGEIAIGWIVTPVIACLISIISLYIVQNVFQVNLLAN